MANKRNKWNEQEQGAKRRRSNQSTTKPQPAASNPNKNTKSTDTNRNSGRPAAAKPAPKPAAPKAKPKQSVTYYSNKNKGARGVAQSAARAVTQKPRVQTAAKDTAKRAEHRLARQTGVQQFVTGRNIPTVMNKPKTFQQTVTPLEQMKADAIAGPRYWASRATVPSKPLTAEEQKKKTQQTAKQSGFNARARNQTLSQWDQKLSQGKQFQIRQAKQRYDEAKAKGDRAGMEKAHREAEALRYTSGYSGGAAGDQRIAPGLGQDAYNKLNSSGRLAMTQAQMTRDRAVTEEEIARADRRIEEILNAPGYQNGRDINTARGMRETAEGRSTMLGATKEQKEKDAAGMKNATLAGIHLGVGGTGHWLEATDWTIANRNRDQNMAKWLQDADNYESARSDLEYYDNYVQTFGEPPAGMNRNVLQMRLNDAIQARAQLERMQTDPHSAYYDETVARRMGLPTDTQSYWEKMIRQGQQEQLASQEGLSPAEKWINDLYISGIQTIPTTAAALIPGGQGGALAGLASAARGLTLAGMGASAAGNRMTELQDAGYAFDKAYRDATISGIIEAGTEMIGVEKLASAAAGKVPQNALRAILEQGLAEGGEEALSYALNTGYNKLTDLPGQEWSWKDFASQTAGGAIMGAVHMGAGVMINSLAASGAVSQERAQRSYQAWQESADQARSLLNDAKQWYAMIDQGAVSREEGEAALSQVSQQINGQAEPVTREWLARQEELLDIEENAIRGAITRQEARDQQSQIMDQMTSQNRDAEANRMAAEWDEEERQARAAQNAAVSARTRLDQRLEDWRWRQEEPVSSNPVEEAKQMTAEALRATDAEMARREAAQTVQAETPPIQWERSGLPPTSFLGAAIDARREARARAEAEAQVRRDQEAVRQATQQNQIEQIAATMGENGRKALMTVAAKDNRAEMAGDFRQVYLQARAGQEPARPQSMAPEQYYAAVSSGRNDLVAGRSQNAGVNWNDPHVRKMDRKTARMADAVAKALGVSVRFVDRSEMMTPEGGVARGSIRGNEVLVWKDTKDPVKEIIGHEFTHRVKDLDGASYQAFEDYVMSLPGAQAALDAIRKTYARHGVKLNEAQAREEVTADYAGELYRDSAELQEFIRRNYENRTLLERVLDFFRDLSAKLTGREKAQADEAVRLLEEAIKGAEAKLEERPKTKDTREGLAGIGEAIDPPSRYSLNSIGDAFGFTAEIDQETGGVKYYRINGKRVKRVTTKDVKKSKLYQLIKIAYDNGTISAEDAQKQADYLRRLMNLVIKTNDSQMIYAFSGSMLWSAAKDNADKQYNMTIDFEAICKRTEQMVAAMSDAMMRKGRGLTLDEINVLYGRVIEAGEPVPCPPCYVFSRWIGLGGLLDNIKRFQTEFPDGEAGTAKARKRLDEIRGVLSEEVNALRAEDQERVRKNLEAQARGEKKSKTDITPKSEDDLTNKAKKDRLAELDKAEGKLITKRNKAIDKLQFKANTETERQKAQAEIDAIDKEYEALTKQMRTLRMFSWLKDVRLSETYKEVPDSILFDLRAGEEFAGRFADTWAFRTGQGAYYGKAITPYTDARVGEVIQGVHKKAAEIQIGEENPFSGDFDADDLTTKQAKELKSAQMAVRRQNLRGGVRMQSVSDFRYEYALDYIQVFFELQAVGAAIQTYTKVVEFVGMAASTGAYVNMSLIPWGTGFDKNGKLAYSSVTGMDAEAAFKLQRMWDTAGTILIGVSDEHIRAAMADKNIYFIIPYHKSGGREDVIRQMLVSLKEVAAKYTDYSDVQGEKFPSQQNPVLAFRNKILLASETFEPTAAERKMLGDNEFLRGLYNRKFHQEDDPLFMVPLTSEDCKHIYPYEYWDVTSTYKTADVNGQRYLQWCEDLGVRPKFSGNAKGEKDFRNDKGYWKLLIDRRMYDRNGNYNPLLPINATGLNLNQLDRERAKQTFGEAMTAPADLRKTKEIVDKAFPETAGARFSISAEDGYNVSGNTASYTDERIDTVLKEYGGGGNYAQGFVTYINPRDFLKLTISDRTLAKWENGLDKGEFPEEFFPLDEEKLRNNRQSPYLRVDTATGEVEGHEGRHRMLALAREGITKAPVVLVDTATKYSKEPTAQMRLTSQDFGDGPVNGGYSVTVENLLPTNKQYREQIKEAYGGEDARVRFSISPQADADYMAAVESGDMETAQRMVDEAAKAAMSDTKILDEDGNLLKVYHGSDQEFTVFDRSKARSNMDIQGMFFSPWEEDADGYGPNVRGFYLNIKNPADERTAYRALNKFKGENKAGVKARIYLGARGYDGVNNSDEEFIAFKPDQIKSADPVTYDDDGNVIPLSERFNAEREDIRYSIAPETIDPVEITPVNEVRDRGMYDYLVSDFEENGWNGRPLVVVENGNNGYLALTGSHRIAAAMEADIDVPAIVLDNNDDILRLLDANDDDERESVARELAEDGIIPQDVADLIIRENDLNFENWDVPYEQRKRYSLSGPESLDSVRLMRENQLLREKLEDWRGSQGKKGQSKVSDKTIQALTKRLVNEYGTEMPESDIASAIRGIFERLGKGESFEQVYRDAEALAGQMVEQTTDAEDRLYTAYRDLRDYLRGKEILVSKELKDQIPGYEALRKSMMGRAKLKNGTETNIDEVYEEAAGLWPEFFDEEIDTTQAAKLEQIGEVLRDVYNREATEGPGLPEGYLATEILASYFDSPALRASVARQAGSRADEMRARHKERYDAALERAKEQKDKALRKRSEQYLASKKRSRERQKEREKRAQILRHIRNLQQRLEKGTDKKNVPKDLRGIAITLLESVNTASKDMKQTKRTQDFVGLRDRLQEMRSDGSPIVLDESLFGDSTQGIQGNLDAVIAMQDIPIANMNLEQLDIVWKTVRAVEHAITTYNRTLASKKFAQTDAWADAIWTDSETKRDMKAIGMMLDLEIPYTYFSQYGDSMLSVYRMLRDAQDLEQRRVDEIAEKTRKIINPKKVKAWSEHRNTFDITWTEATDEGMEERSTTLTLTDAQIMDLYLLSRRPQAQEHLLKGGIVQPEIKTGRKKIDRGNEAIPLTAEKIGEITAKLSDEQVDVAKKLQKLTSDMAKWGNEASLNVYGYEKFTEDNYWPIHTAAEGIHSSVENNRSNPRSIKNIGLAKTTVPHASNPVDLSSVFDNFGRHASEMITYATWLAPMEDANRLYNWTFRDADNQKTGRTIKGMLDRVGGKGGKEYWHNLMEDIQNGLNGDSDTWISRKINRIIGNAKGAAVGANIRVVIQQPTAMVRANAVMNPADLAAGIFAAPTKGSGWKKAKKWAGIAARKDAGGFDVSSPARSGKTYFGQQTGLERLSDKAGALAGFADAVTWGRIWNAAEWQVARQNKDLTKGSAEYYRKVAEVFTNVIDQTQVVDGVLQRSQIMRSSNEIVKQATAFMGEPIMGLNMIIRNWNNWRYQTDPKKRTAARKSLAKASTAFVATAVVNALAQAVVDGLRDDDKDREYQEKLIAAFLGTDLEGAKALAASIMDAAKNDEPDTTFAQRLAAAYAERMSDEDAKWGKDLKDAMLNGNLAENLNPMGSIPFVSDILSMFKGYDVTRADADVVADVIKKGQYWIESMEGDGKQTKWYATVQLAAQVGKLFGIPGHTIIRDVSGGLRTFAQKTGNVPMMYELEKAIYSTGSSKNKKLFESIAWAALQDGDLDTFNRIREDLMESGITDGKKLDNAMKKLAEANPDVELTQHIRDLIGVHPTFATKEEEEEDKFGADSLDGTQYAAYSEQRANTYRPLEDEAMGMDAWNALGDEEKDKVLKSLWNYADKTSLADHSDGQYEITDSTVNAMVEAAEHEVTPVQYAILTGATSDIHSAKTSDGEEISGSASVLKREAMNATGITLSETGQAYMDEKLDISATVQGYSADELAKAVADVHAQEQGTSKYAKYGEDKKDAVKAAYEFKKNVRADIGPNGKPIRGSAKAKVVAEVRKIPGLTTAQQNEILEDMGYSM